MSPRPSASTNRATRPSIDLSALIVEAVRQLVTDDAADRAVVDRRVGVGIEHRRLQNAGRENDVAQRAVVGVVSLRRHAPIGSIDRAIKLPV